MPTEEERRRRVRGTRTPIQREEPASDPVRSGIGDLARGAYNTARGISNAVGSVTVGPALDLGANAIALATGNDPRTRPGGVAGFTAAFNEGARDAQREVTAGVGPAIQSFGGRLTGAQPISRRAPEATAATPAAAEPQPRGASGSTATPSSPTRPLQSPAQGLQDQQRARPATLPGGVVESIGGFGERSFSSAPGSAVRSAGPAPQPLSLTDRLNRFSDEAQQRREIAGARSAQANAASLAEARRQQRRREIENELTGTVRGGRSQRELQAELGDIAAANPVFRTADQEAAIGTSLAQTEVTRSAADLQRQQVIGANLGNQSAQRQQAAIEQLGPGSAIDSSQRRSLIDQALVSQGKDPDAGRFIAIDSVIGTDALGNPVQGRRLFDSRTGSEVGGGSFGPTMGQQQPRKGTFEEYLKATKRDPAFAGMSQEELRRAYDSLPG